MTALRTETWSVPACTRIRWAGNPKFYACYVDEGLNMLLRSTAERSHRIKFEYRIFKLFLLVSKLGLNRYVYVPCPISM
eukprot:9477781-Pyramimonas_sp.AAC.1